ncbi:molybdenum cofactor guanylyltransferase [Romboutsia weinsteinii]|uniref:Probable molybdenum cofactor guanylyltransferase n=1 Tax=Romboutsia weinsteinii TaxID=2020949 RepID=A0A371J146_9FIRM|nr:molybdenum cofactor guanylyltransferase [Romboutsia weinsteinii]RDY26386.1 molybdenum cofactor guanylyltransferase [Romboutsia weinsteinii]
MINKTLAILAGGQSSRMNYNNKAFLDYRGKSFIEYLISLGKDYKEVIIVANDQEIYKKFNVRVVKDMYVGNGPLSGIHSALKNATTDKVLCIACDMPLMNEEIIKTLGEYKGEYQVLVPKVDNRLQPLCSIYSKSIIGNIEDSLNRNENKLQRLITSLEYKIIEGFCDESFKNVNTPEEYRSLD